MALGDFQRRTLYDRSWKIGGAELIQRDGVWYLHITQTNDDAAPDEPTGYLGVDLGVGHIATDSDGVRYSGLPVERTRQWYQARRAVLQRVGTKSAKRDLKKLKRRQRRLQKDLNPQISKRLVGTAKGTGRGIALEDLKGIRGRVMVHGADQRARHSDWGFFQLRQFVSYKAQRAGYGWLRLTRAPPASAVAPGDRPNGRTGKRTPDSAVSCVNSPPMRMTTRRSISNGLRSISLWCPVVSLRLSIEAQAQELLAWVIDFNTVQN